MPVYGSSSASGPQHKKKRWRSARTDIIPVPSERTPAPGTSRFAAEFIDAELRRAVREQKRKGNIIDLTDAPMKKVVYEDGSVGYVPRRRLLPRQR